MNFLKALRADLLTPEEKEQLKRLEARYPEVPLDRTRIKQTALLATEFFQTTYAPSAPRS